MIYSPDLVLELEATPEQQEIINWRAEFLCLLAGRRWGKTIGVVRNRIVSRCLEEEGFEYLFTAPSMGQVEPEYLAIVSHPDLEPFIRRAVYRPYPRIEWDNGSVAKFRSLDKPHLLRRDGYDEIWVDEIQDVKESVVDSVLIPMTADRRGSLGMSGQSRGEEHYIFKRFFAPGQNPKNWRRIRSWRFSIYDGLMFQSKRGKAKAQALEAMTPRNVWESEYLALPTANSKAVFRYEDLEAAKRGEIQEKGIEGHRYILGHDLGRIKDPSSYVVLDGTTEVPTVVEAKIRPMRERHEITSQILLREKRRFNDATFVIDNTGAGKGSASKIDQYVRHYQTTIPDAIPFLWDPRNKKKIIDQLCLAIEQRLIAIPACLTELHHQLGVYEFIDKGEWIAFSAPAGEHDDLVAALAMAWNAYILGWGGRMKSLGSLAVL